MAIYFPPPRICLLPLKEEWDRADWVRFWSWMTCNDVRHLDSPYKEGDVLEHPRLWPTATGGFKKVWPVHYGWQEQPKDGPPCVVVMTHEDPAWYASEAKAEEKGTKYYRFFYGDTVYYVWPGYFKTAEGKKHSDAMQGIATECLAPLDPNREEER